VNSFLKIKKLNTMSQENNRQLIKNIYEGELFDLGETSGEERFRGIFTPKYDANLISNYLTPQFTKGAKEYISRYDNVEIKKSQISRIFSHIGLLPHKGFKILDLGSGGGSSVFALSSLCPGSSIIASDLSCDMLLMLKQAWSNSEAYNAANISLLQLNCESLNFKPNSFDLVFGSAILHHLLSPEKPIESCSHILKRNGVAIFFEPFEFGHALLSMIFESILNDKRSELISPLAAIILKSMMIDWKVRKGKDKSAEIYKILDDKWLFNKQYFLDLASQHGFSYCEIRPLYNFKNPFEMETERLLQEGLTSQRDILPTWAWDIIKAYDSQFSEECKSEILFECFIVFTKNSSLNSHKSYKTIKQTLRNLFHNAY
jgi:ubiquinone/menaquinone biosynthesis C-methylase UbiE